MKWKIFQKALQKALEEGKSVAQLLEHLYNNGRINDKMKKKNITREEAELEIEKEDQFKANQLQVINKWTKCKMQNERAVEIFSLNDSFDLY